MATPNIVPRADSEGGIGTSSKYWASAYIDLIYVGAGKVGRDADNLLDFSADNHLTIRLNAGNKLVFDGARVYPSSNDGYALGLTNYSFSDLFLASGAVIGFDNGNFTLTHSSNHLTLADGDAIGFGNANDLKIYHDGSTTNYIQNSDGSLIIKNTAADNDIIFQADDGSGGVTTYLTLDGSVAKTTVHRPLKFDDSISAEYGTGTDMIMYHSGSTGYIENYTGNFQLIQQVDDGDIIFKCDDGSGGNTAYITLDGGNTRIDISKFMRFADGVEARFGAQSDLQVHHDGSNSYISQNGTGDLYIKQMTTDEDLVFQCDDGAGGDATYFFLDGSSATHSGSATTALYTNWPDYSRISLGTSHDMLMYHDSSQTVFQNKVGNFYITQAADDLDIIFQCDDGSGGTTAYITLDGSLTRTIANQHLQMADGKALYVGAGSDAGFYHLSGHNYIENNTGDLYITNSADDKDIIFQSDNGSGGTTTYFKLDGSRAGSDYYYTTFPDKSVLEFGTGNDLQIWHDGSHSQIKNVTGNLTIRVDTDDGDIIFQSDDASGGIAEYFRVDGGVTKTIFSKQLRLQDNVELEVGSSVDLKIYHNATDSVIENENGNLYIVNDADDKDIIFQCDDGSGGLETYFFLDGSATSGSPVTIFPDNSYLYFGDGLDFSMAHNGSNTVVSNITGNLYFDQNTDNGSVYFRCDDGSGALATYFQVDGASEILQVHKDLYALDSVKLRAGAAGDLSMYHDATDSYITNDTGHLLIYQNGDDKDIIFRNDNGSGGTTPYLTLDGGDVSTIVNTIKVLMPNLPTSDPSTAGQLWNDSGTLKISAG